MNAPLSASSLSPAPHAPRIAFIQSSWHADIVNRCREAFLKHTAEASDGTVKVDLFQGRFPIAHARHG